MKVRRIAAYLTFAAGCTLPVAAAADGQQIGVTIVNRASAPVRVATSQSCDGGYQQANPDEVVQPGATSVRSCLDAMMYDDNAVSLFSESNTLLCSVKRHVHGMTDDDFTIDNAQGACTASIDEHWNVTIVYNE